MNHTKVCPKCHSEMLMGTESGYFAIIEAVDSSTGKMTRTNDYMCKNCGYVEIYAENPRFTETE